MSGKHQPISKYRSIQKDPSCVSHDIVDNRFVLLKYDRDAIEKTNLVPEHSNRAE